MLRKNAKAAKGDEKAGKNRAVASPPVIQPAPYLLIGFPLSYFLRLLRFFAAIPSFLDLVAGRSLSAPLRLCESRAEEQRRDASATLGNERLDGARRETW